MKKKINNIIQRGSDTLTEWKNVTNYFTEEQRHYKNTYLEIDYVGNDKIKLGLYSSKNDLYEIYISFWLICGIVYVKEENANKIYYEIKDKIEEEYIKNKEPSDKFIREFDEKYGICLSNDLFFDKEMPDDFTEQMFKNKDLKINTHESFNEMDRRVNNFITEILESGKNNVAIVMHGIILLSYLGSIAHENFDGKKFKITFNNKVILNGTPSAPDIYKLEFDDNNSLINIENI